MNQDISKITFCASGRWIEAWPLLLPFVLLRLLLGGAAFKTIDQSGFHAFLLFLMITAAWFAWIKLHRVRISNGIVEYRSGMGFSSQVDISKGFKAKSVSKTGGVWGWMIKMPRNFYSISNGREEVLMNLKPFSRRDLRKIRELLPEK